MAAFKSYVVWFPAHILSRVNGFQMAAGGLGALAATVPVEWALGVTDWRGVFLGLAVLSFAASLAIGGRDGTLWSRFREDDEVDKLRGKTGTLNGVHCLAGYVEAADGQKFAFAFLVNDMPYSIARARRVHDRFADLMFSLDQTSVARSAP